MEKPAERKKADNKKATEVEKPAEGKKGDDKKASEESAVQQSSNQNKVAEKTSDVEKTYAELSDKKVPEKMAPEKSKLPAAPSNNEPPGGSEEESESSNEEVS